MNKFIFIFVSIFFVTIAGYGGGGGGGSSSSAPTTSPPVIIASDTAALSWTAPAHASDLSGYNVYRATSSGGTYTKLNSTTITDTSYTTPAFAAGTYYFVVRSVDTNGNEGGNSNEVNKTLN